MARARVAPAAVAEEDDRCFNQSAQNSASSTRPDQGRGQGRSDLNFGTYGLKAVQPERITARQIEAARRAMTRHMKRQGRVWIRIFPTPR